MNTFGRGLLILAAAALTSSVDAQTSDRRATLTGGGTNGNGKCTIEVYVDGSADVEIRGDRGMLRTRSGRSAQWRRFECSGPIPANPTDFRFAGVDGRGRQELIQDPKNGAPIVVRIEDSQGGAEGYTFDLMWRGTDSDSRPSNQPFGGGRDMNRRVSSNDADRACQDAVREKAYQQYGVRDLDFANLNTDDNQDRRDTINGSFDVPRGNGRISYRFSCALDMSSGRVRQVEISQGERNLNRYSQRSDSTSACQRAVEERIERDGYRNVQIGSLNSDGRRNDWIAGTARAQRGNSGRAYDFDISCSMNPDNGAIQSVQARRR